MRAGLDPRRASWSHRSRARVDKMIVEPPSVDERSRFSRILAPPPRRGRPSRLVQPRAGPGAHQEGQVAVAGTMTKKAQALQAHPRDEGYAGELLGGRHRDRHHLQTSTLRQTAGRDRRGFSAYFEANRLRGPERVGDGRSRGNRKEGLRQRTWSEVDTGGEAEPNTDFSTESVADEVQIGTRDATAPSRRRRGVRTPRIGRSAGRCCSSSRTRSMYRRSLAMLEARRRQADSRSRAPIPFIGDNLRFFAGAAARVSRRGTKGYTSIIRREPIGVAGLIAPGTTRS